MRSKKRSLFNEDNQPAFSKISRLVVYILFVFLDQTFTES